jgi:hypothetical protein
MSVMPVRQRAVPPVKGEPRDGFAVPVRRVHRYLRRRPFAGRF